MWRFFLAVSLNEINGRYRIFQPRRFFVHIIGFLSTPNRQYDLFVTIFETGKESSPMIIDYNKPAEQKKLNDQQKEMDALSKQYDTYIKLTGKFLELKAIREQMRENNKAPGKTRKQ